MAEHSYTATATAIAGRDGHVESSDHIVSFDLSIPASLGGPGKAGATNPEQLFAAGYAACFGSAVDHVARMHKTPVKDVSVTCATTLHATDAGFHISAELHVKIPGMDHAAAEKLVAEAHTVCPYSKATHGNVDVKLVVLD